MEKYHTQTDHVQSDQLCRTGIAGLDQVIGGGLPANCLYVVQGEPGAGKTTLALQFLMEGARVGEKVLYITFSETKRELLKVARSHGWDLSNISIIDLSLLEAQFSPETQSTLFHPSEIELTQITDKLVTEINELCPSRIVFESVSEMRLLAENPLRYRRQILALKQNLAPRDATVLFLDDLTIAAQDVQVQSLAHGVISLTRLHHDFGGERRRIRVLKLRGVDFKGGNHDFDIRKGGLVVYPRMISSNFSDNNVRGVLKSGSPQLDSLVGGGLDRGTSNLIIGPAGTGKSTIGMKYALAATEAGEKVAYFCFDETIANFYKRAKALNLNFESAEKKGLFYQQKVNPAELSPGAFSGLIQTLVAEQNVKVVVIDSMNGYVQSMPQEHFLVLQLHELLAYLNNQGVVTIMMLTQQGMIGSMTSPVDLTYLADTVILTRYFEADGTVRKAISVVKKRTGAHERSIRELTIDNQGLHVGETLSNFRGVLTGVPQFTGKTRPGDAL
jgi:circadian clock protein KaiC